VQLVSVDDDGVDDDGVDDDGVDDDGVDVYHDFTRSRKCGVSGVVPLNVALVAKLSSSFISNVIMMDFQPIRCLVTK
jgi:hypothetical protein